MKTVSLILFIIAFPASVQVASSAEGKPRTAVRLVEAPRKKNGFFEGLGRLFRPGGSHSQQVVVTPPPPSSGGKSKKSSSSSSSNTGASKLTSTEKKQTQAGVSETAPPSNPTVTKSAESTAALATATATQPSPTTAKAPPTTAKAPPTTAKAPPTTDKTPPTTAQPSTPMAATAPATPPAVKPSKPSEEPKKSPIATEFNKERYIKAKETASRDPKIEALAVKLETAKPGDPYKSAAKNYTKALFSKIREVDTTQNEWIERLESATLRRIDAGKAIVVE